MHNSTPLEDIFSQPAILLPSNAPDRRVFARHHSELKRHRLVVIDLLETRIRSARSVPNIT